MTNLPSSFDEPLRLELQFGESISRQIVEPIVKYNTSQLNALMRLFSSSVYRELATMGKSKLFRRLIDQTEIASLCDSHASVADAFEVAFRLLKPVGLRNEYIYRTALTHKVLLGKHSLRTSSMLSEFRVGICRADLVILNGTSTAYEIKTERDSLVRLDNQIENYQRVFAAVNVIVCESHCERVLSTVPENVGVLCLSNRYQISTVREAIACPQSISPLAVFDSIRAAEAIAILRALGVSFPQVPNTERNSKLRESFAEIDPAILHCQLVHTLKQTRSLISLSNLVEGLPNSLHANALSIQVRRSDHSRLVEAVATPLSASMAWR